MTGPASDRTELGSEGARGRLAVAMAANSLMFFAGLGWRLARSTALLADAFDMLSDTPARAAVEVSQPC